MAHRSSTTAHSRKPGNERAGDKPAASGVLVTDLAGGAAGRVAPLHGELTLSFLTRLAARYHLVIRDLLTAITDVGGLQNLTGMLYPDSEIHLNAQARARVAELCRVAPQVLERSLPAWTREEPCGRYGAGPVGRLMRGEEAVAAWGPTCPACTAARTGRLVAARRYLAPEQRVCARHRYWLLYVPGTSGLPVPLGRCPEVIDAHLPHVRLLRRSPTGAQQAFEVARAVTGSWWQQPWPDKERAWPARLKATRPDNADPSWWKAAARDLITYPETVALARLLVSRLLQQRTITESGGHLPYRLGELPRLLTDLADRLARPWLTRRLAADTHGPLFAWAHSLVRTHTAPTPAAHKALWKVPPTHRPRSLGDLLPGQRPDPGSEPPGPPAPPRMVKRLRGYSLQAEHAFTRGLAHARLFHEEHGHLAVPKQDTPGGYPLGQWLANQRAEHPRMPQHHFMALAALDPRWNAPWNPRWQRLWHQAAQHTRTHGRLKAASGFPTAGINLAQWLYEQCTRHDDLHPEQRRLLTQIGIDSSTAAAARPPRRSYAERFQTGLAHAAAYATQHGQLATVGQRTVHDGFPLGNWLALLRNRDRPPVPADRVQALDALDAWWNPPWSLYWQRHYYRARDTALGHPLRPETGCHNLGGFAARWLGVQCSAYDELHSQQRQLLADIGITTKVARIARDHARTTPKRLAATPAPNVEDKASHVRMAADPAASPGRRPTRRATDPKRPHEPRNRLGHRPDLRPDFETALAHARAWHAEHGHLAVPRTARHGGYPLGTWLFSQRNRAKQRARDRLPPSPHLQKLAAIDPWWNPPWDLHWQRNYYRARDHVEAGHPFDPAALIPSPATALGTWISRACLNYHRLHPGQQHLLALIGISADVAHARTRRAHPWRTAVEHAQVFAETHGHLAVPRDTIHNGFPLGQWLNKQRYRTRKTGPTPAARALTSIDPWWNPPWGMVWQRAYQQARNQPHTPASRRWIQKQRRFRLLLHTDQQHLLTTAGLINI